MERTEEEEKVLEERFDRIIDTMDSIDLNKISILTGDNGSGKSLIRKQIGFRAREDKIDIISTSMDLRTGSNSSWGAMSSIMNDTEWTATSSDTIRHITRLMKEPRRKPESKKNYYLIIDEFEIGCGEEMVLALISLINTKLKALKDDNLITGAMIITHSRMGVSKLEHDDFVNIQGMNRAEWLDRELVPVDIDSFVNDGLFCYIRDIMKKNRE